MNKITAAAALGIFLMSTTNGESIYAREVRQQHRLREGVRRGELTASEVARLRQRSANIRREIHRDRLDDGGLSPAERQKIHRMQYNLDRQIYRQKHDNQVR